MTDPTLADTDPAALSELARLKLPLVERDYASYFDETTRNMERIGQLRNIEVTLITAISVVLMTRLTFPVLAILPLYLPILVFFVLNAAVRSRLLLMQDDAVEQERRLQASTLSEFVANVAQWRFGNTLAQRRGWSKQYRYMVKSLFAPESVMWHGGLMLAVTALLVAVLI